MTKEKLLLILICLPLLAFNQSQRFEEDKKAIKWLKKNHHPFEIGTTDFSFLDEYIEGKRIVFLGEAVHGVKEFERVRIDIIKYLNEKHGFDVLLFENDMDALALVNNSKATLSPKEMLSNLYPVWHSKDLLDLMTFIKEDENFEIAGFDNQLMSSYRGTYLTDRFPDKLMKISEKGVGFAYNEEAQPDFETKRIEIIKEYEALLKELKPTEENYNIKKQILESNIKLIKNANHKEWPGQYRDSLMAQNLEWLISEVYPNRKIIVWAANIHLMPCKNNDVIPELYYSGEVLFNNNTIRDESYILFTGHWSGYTSMYNGTLVSPLQSYNGVEQLFNQMSQKPFFVDLTSQSITKGNEWMNNEVDIFPATTLGNDMTKRTRNMNLVPKDCFDGFIYFRKVNASEVIRQD